MVGSGSPGVVAHHLTSDAFDAFGHLGCGATGTLTNRIRRGSLNNQMGDPMGQRVGLAEPAPAMTSSSAAASSPAALYSTARPCCNLDAFLVLAGRMDWLRRWTLAERRQRERRASIVTKGSKARRKAVRAQSIRGYNRSAPPLRAGEHAAGRNSH